MSEEPLLSAEETEALLDAMRNGDEGDNVEGIDLTSPERRIRAALPIADKAGEEVAELLRRIFLRHAGTANKTESAPAEINPFSVVVGGIRPGSALAKLRIGESFGFVTLGPSLVSFLLERQMGAPLRIEDQEEARSPREELTPVDRRVLRPIFSDLAGELSENWFGASDVIQLESVEHDAHTLPEIESFEPVLRLACEVKPSVAPAGEVTLVFASSAVSIAFGASDEPETKLSPSEADRMKRRVDATEIEVAAVLGRTESTIGDVLKLKIGDVIRLDGIPGEPCRIIANGVAVLRGRPVTEHGNLAVEIVPPR